MFINVSRSRRYLLAIPANTNEDCRSGYCPGRRCFLATSSIHFHFRFRGETPLAYLSARKNRVCDIKLCAATFIQVRKDARPRRLSLSSGVHLDSRNVIVVVPISCILASATLTGERKVFTVSIFAEAKLLAQKHTRDHLFAFPFRISFRTLLSIRHGVSEITSRSM
jgi:hypothetical protein